MPDSTPDLDTRSSISHDPRQTAMDPLRSTAASRRAVLGGVAGLGAVAAAAAIGNGTRLPNPLGDVAPAGVLATKDTLVAHVRPGSRDEVTLYSGHHEVTVTDRALVQALLAALGNG